ncbi:MAG: hypothetical protein JSV84_10760 [Gemmatimonadota bacterium]|nr:MAG: hypothetical protein JSV84_10760 [Gemmatimonadota bacterium]
MKKILFISYVLIVSIPTLPLLSQEAVLTLTHGSGVPGSNSNIIHVELEHDQYVVSSFEIYILFEPNILSVCDHELSECPHCGPCCVCAIERTTEWSIFQYFSKEDAGTLGVVGYTEGHVLEPGINAIAEVKIDVAETVPVNEYKLYFGRTQVKNPAAEEIPSTTIDGVFSVVHKGDVNHDGSVDVLDVVLTGLIFLEQYQPTFGELSIADCIDDNEITLEDAFCIVDVILTSYSKKQKK